jgi:hypothetical protein
LAGRKGDASTVFLRLFGRAAGTKTGVALRELSAIELEQVSGGDTCCCGCGVSAGAQNSAGDIYASFCGGQYNWVGGQAVPINS